MSPTPCSSRVVLSRISSDPGSPPYTFDLLPSSRPAWAKCRFLLLPLPFVSIQCCYERERDEGCVMSCVSSGHVWIGVILFCCLLTKISVWFSVYFSVYHPFQLFLSAHVPSCLMSSLIPPLPHPHPTHTPPLPLPHHPSSKLAWPCSKA